MAKRGNWRGCPDIIMVSRNEWDDPDLIYDGLTFNYWDIEDALWDMFLEDTGHKDNESNNPEVEEEFSAYVRENAPAYLDDVIAGGYFEDGKTSWRESKEKKSFRPNLSESFIPERSHRAKVTEDVRKPTTVTHYRNKRNPHKRAEVHRDGYGHRTVKPYMQWDEGEEIDYGNGQKVIQRETVHNTLGDGRFHRWRKDNFHDVFETDYEVMEEGCAGKSKKRNKKHLVSESSARKVGKRLKESVSTDNVIWDSEATRDWLWGLTKDEKVRKLFDAGYSEDDFAEYDDDGNVVDFDEDTIDDLLLDRYCGSDYDADYEKLQNKVAPAIAKQCYGGYLWLLGNYQRWNGGHTAMGYYSDAENDIVDICYPRYDSHSWLSNEDGKVVFGESSHDAPMGGTSMTLYSFKDRESYDDADNDEDGEGVDFGCEDIASVKRWIEQGWLTPVDANELFKA